MGRGSLVSSPSPPHRTDIGVSKRRKREGSGWGGGACDPPVCDGVMLLD